MNLGSPISSVIPSGHGPVLAVLARTERPLTGRRVAALLDGVVSQKQVSNILGKLVAAGIVLKEEHPPAHLYRLNRDHVAAEPICQLATLRQTLLDRVRSTVEKWQVLPEAVWLFGSFARGDGDDLGDIDILVLGPVGLEGAEPEVRSAWDGQVDDLTERVYNWSGNDCRILEFMVTDYADREKAGERLPREVSRDGIHIYGREIPRPLGGRAG